MNLLNVASNAIRKGCEMKLSKANQKKAHKAFVDKVLSAENTDEVSEVLKQFPELEGRLSLNPSKEVEAMSGDNVDICEYLYTQDETSKAYEFANKSDRNKTVAQTVRANIRAYRQIVDNEKAEDDSEYKAIYSDLKKDFEKYFEITAERGMLEYYGEKYAAIAKEFENKQEQAKQKRKAGKAAKAEA